MRITGLTNSTNTNTINKPKHKTSFKNSTAALTQPNSDIFEVSAKRDTAIIDYLESAQKRDAKNQKVNLIAASGTLALIPVFLYYMYKVTGRQKSKKTLDTITAGFKSLKDADIPTLDTCKSINKKMRDCLQTELNYANASKEDLKRAGQPRRTNKLLLYGPPGTGKTYFAKIFAKTLGADYLEIKYSDLNHRFVGQHIENMKTAFDGIIETATKNKDKRYVVTLNEIDAIIVPQQGLIENGGGHTSFKLEERNVFLNYIDEIEEKAPNVTIICTTNRLAKADALDGAAMSRFSRKMMVDYPDKGCLKEALIAHLKEIGEGDEFLNAHKDKWDNFTESLVNRKFSFRDLDYLIDYSKQYYLGDCLKDKSSKFKFEYLEKARNLREVTDGEAAGIV